MPQAKGPSIFGVTSDDLRSKNSRRLRAGVPVVQMLLPKTGYQGGSELRDTPSGLSF